MVEHLGLTDFHHSVPAVMLARVLLWVAATRRSLSALCGCSDKTPRAETVRQALWHCLPGDQQELCNAVWCMACMRSSHVQHAVGSDRWPSTCPCVPPMATSTKADVIGGQRQAGTQYFWTYATLVVLVRGLRVTVGLTAVEPGQSLTAVLDVLLAQACQAGVRPAWLLLDRGFYAAEVVQYLQQQGLKFVLPMIRRGKKAQETGTLPFCRSSGWDSYRVDHAAASLGGGRRQET